MFHIKLAQVACTNTPCYSNTKLFILHEGSNVPK